MATSRQGLDRGAQLWLRPVGWVRQGRAPQAGDDHWEESEAEIEIEAELSEGLDGIEGFSHIWVLWWLDRAEESHPLRVHPERREDMPLVGVFSTRSPQRPNAIAMTAVRLLARRHNRLLVQGLDAYEGTPVLDIKPYLPRGDLIQGARTPVWLQDLWRGQGEASGTTGEVWSA